MLTIRAKALFRPLLFAAVLGGFATLASAYTTGTPGISIRQGWRENTYQFVTAASLLSPSIPVTLVADNVFLTPGPDGALLDFALFGNRYYVTRWVGEVDLMFLDGPYAAMPAAPALSPPTVVITADRLSVTVGDRVTAAVIGTASADVPVRYVAGAVYDPDSAEIVSATQVNSPTTYTGTLTLAGVPYYVSSMDGLDYLGTSVTDPVAGYYKQGATQSGSMPIIGTLVGGPESSTYTESISWEATPVSVSGDISFTATKVGTYTLVGNVNGTVFAASVNVTAAAAAPPPAPLEISISGPTEVLQAR